MWTNSVFRSKFKKPSSLNCHILLQNKLCMVFPLHSNALITINPGNCPEHSYKERLGKRLKIMQQAY